VIDDALAGVIEVAGVVAAIGVHVVEVLLGFDVWVEELDVGEGLGPSVEGLVDDKGDAGGEVSESSSVKVDVIDVG